MLAGMDAQLLPLGDRALLLRSGLPRSVATARRLARLAQQAQELPELREVVAGFTELLCYVAPGAADPSPALRALWAESALDDAPVPAARQHEVRVTYDGADLAAVAAQLGLTVEEVIQRHVARRAVVAVSGFRPDFAYCLGIDPRLQVPRKASPVMVAAGAVAIADGMTAIYPSPGPGGWQVVGHCDPRCCARLALGDELCFIRAAGSPS